jgi:LPS-assembly protein
LFRDNNGEIISADVYNHVLLEEPDLRIVGDQAHVQFLTNDLELDDAEFRNYAQHGRGVANMITRHDKEPISMKEVSYTTCPPGDNMWEIHAKELKLDTETEQGYAYNSWVTIKGVPIAYTPWISFPLSNKRKSGLLKPTLGQSDRSGYEFRIPYYWNIAPNYDATITPLYQTKRGTHLHTEQRYLWSNGEGQFLAELQPHDRELAKFKEHTLLFNPNHLDPNDPRFQNVENANLARKAIGWKNNWEMSPQWNFNNNFEWASDDQYFVDLDSAIGGQNYRNLQRQATLQFHGQYLDLRSQIEAYQVLQPYNADIVTPPYRLLPEIVANFDFPDVVEDVELQLPLNFTAYDHEGDPLTHVKPPTGQRYDAGPGIRYRYHTPYSYISPHVQLRYSKYDLKNNIDNPEHIDRTIPISSLDTGLYFERDLQWMDHDFTQTLEPRLFYVYIPYHNQDAIPAFDAGLSTFSFDQLFVENRFSGRDRIGDANQVSYSAITRWLRSDSGVENAQLSMGQIIYFADRRVTLTTPDNAEADFNSTDRFSDFVTEGVYHIADHWNLVGDLFWNPHNSTFSRYSARLEWQQKVDRLVNFRYNAIRSEGVPDQISTDASFVWRFNPRWRIVSRWNYDWTNQLVIDEFGGVEYENCCWAIRTGARGTLNLNNGHHQSKDQHFFVQWVFKGLMGFGEGFVDQKGLFIPGYRDNFGTTY